MQRVSAFLPSWDKRASSSASNSNSAAPTNKTGGLFGWSNRRSSTTNTNGLANINVNVANRSSTATSLSNGRVHREAFWPATLDLECEKAARIIKSFCADGYLAPLHDELPSTEIQHEPRTPIRVPKKIPKRIIQNAAGIAVFTCMRNGMWMTGSGGSGILIARKSDGTWSPPSGIMLHTPTLSFIMGVDIYDCVLIINSLAALESITRQRVTLGEDVGLTSGSSVPVDAPETIINIKELGNTVMTYMKARGQEQKVNLHGCILTERTNENERFYGVNVTQMDVLAGNVFRHVEETQPLFEVIRMAEGRTDFDPAMISKIAMEPAPGDAVIASPHSTPQSPRQPFGRPNMDDPDPFGILALEMAGMEIREAGTRLRPTSSQLDFHHRPISQLSNIVHRQSGATYMTRSNRDSYMSTRTVRSQMTDNHTQTATTGNATPETSPSPCRSEDGQVRTSFGKIKEDKELEDEEEIDYTAVDYSSLKRLSHPPLGEEAPIFSATANDQDPTRLGLPSANEDMDKSSEASSIYAEDVGVGFKAIVVDDTAQATDTNDADDEDDEEEEEPVIFEVATVQPTRTKAVASRMVHAKGNVVTIGKRIPPPLPMRNPARSSLASSRASLASKSDTSVDAISLRSPLRQAFSEVDLNAEDDTPVDDAKFEEVGEEVSAERLSIERSKPQALETGVPMVDESEVATPRIATPPVKEATVGVPKVIEPEIEKEAEVEKVKEQITMAGKQTSKAEEQTPAYEEQSNAEAEEAKDETLVATNVEEADDKSDFKKEDRLSVGTEVSDDHSSVEESSYTTPTSERRFSFEEEMDEVTPKTTKQEKESEPSSADDYKLDKTNPVPEPLVVKGTAA